MWTRDSALAFISEIYPAIQAAGYHLGLTGSVMTNGESRHDLDLIVYPASTAKQDVAALEAALTGVGLTKRFDRDIVRNAWRKKGSQDDKHVEAWFDANRRRVDIFRLT
jgi:hypothetical protein